MHSTSVPFSNLRPELSLKRRGNTTPPIPMESDDIVPKERRIAGPYGTASLQEAWDKLYKARAILEAEQNHLRDDRIALQGEIDALNAREQQVAEREQRIRQVELQAELERVEEEEARASESPFAKLTKAPFRMAKSVFDPKK
jgi:DNA repair exonuclease SbcCD ATPase subunit